jgi:hypothetical protein
MAFSELLFDHFVGAAEQRNGNVEAERVLSKMSSGVDSRCEAESSHHLV